MAEPKIKPAKRVAGRSKFRLPERTPRSADEVNPLRELLQEARAQEEARSLRESRPARTPATQSAGVSPAPAAKLQKRRAADTGTRPTEAHAASVAGVERERARDAADPNTIHTFADFSKRWSSILRSGQMSVCRAIFEMTHAVGETECFTSMPRLAAAAGLKERQCYYIISQLEMFGFIERPAIFNTSTQKGTVFRLNLEPGLPNTRSLRRYHIGSEKTED